MRRVKRERDREGEGDRYKEVRARDGQRKMLPLINKHCQTLLTMQAPDAMQIGGLALNSHDGIAHV